MYTTEIAKDRRMLKSLHTSYPSMSWFAADVDVILGDVASLLAIGGAFARLSWAKLLHNNDLGYCPL
jgi:hypothetical protein